MQLKDLIVQHAYNNKKIKTTARKIAKDIKEAEELIQSTIFRLIEKNRPFEYLGENHFIRFFITTMTRIHSNKQRNKRLVYTDQIPQIEDQSRCFSEELENRQFIQEVLKRYDNNNVKFIIRAYFYEGLNTREISEKYNINMNTVSSRLARGQSELRTLVKESGLL